MRTIYAGAALVLVKCLQPAAVIGRLESLSGFITFKSSPMYRASCRLILLVLVDTCQEMHNYMSS